MDDSSTKPATANKQSARTSRQASNASSRASSRLSMQAAEQGTDDRWKNFLNDLLGDDQADYFINPKPKEHRVSIDPMLYKCHGLDDAWGALRRKADERLHEYCLKKSSQLTNRSDATIMREKEKDDLDAAYFAFGRMLLSEKGRVFPPRVFSDRADEYRTHLKKLADKNAIYHAAKYNQETGVSYRAACVNTDRCAHLMEQAQNKGNSQFYAERQTEGAVFSEDFSDPSLSVRSKDVATESSSASSSRRKASRQPRLIFLTPADAEVDDEETQLNNLWSRKTARALPSATGSSPSNNDDAQGRELAPSNNLTSAADKWQPLSYAAASEWGKVISKS